MDTLRSILGQPRISQQQNDTPRQWLETAIKEKRIKLIANKKLTDHGIAMEGGNGSVQPAYWAKRDVKVAIKSIFRIGAGSTAYADLKREVEMLLKVGNEKGIVPFLGLTQDPATSQYMMVFQLADGGNLEEYLQQWGHEMRWMDRLRLAAGVTNGLAHIHAQDVLHKDLHSKNILIQNGQAVISDFGCSRLVDYDGTRTDAVGRDAFCAPEKLEKRKEHVYDKACDVYSLGAVLWQISSGRAPFSNIPKWQIIGKVCNGERETPIPGTPKDYIQLYTECWDQDPTRRPEIDDILSRLENIQPSLLLYDHAVLIESWMSQSHATRTWKLLYRGSRDGFKASDFHRCCDEKGPTVMILQPHGVNRLIGGFNSMGWKSGPWDDWSEAPGSFIYSIWNGANHTFVSRLRKEYSDGFICNDRECGPAFGEGDLFISNDCNQSSESYCRSDTYDGQLMDDMEKDGYGFVWFKVEEYEVYSVK